MIFSMLNRICLLFIAYLRVFYAKNKIMDFFFIYLYVYPEYENVIAYVTKWRTIASARVAMSKICKRNLAKWDIWGQLYQRRLA